MCICTWPYILLNIKYSFLFGIGDDGDIDSSRLYGSREYNLCLSFSECLQLADEDIEFLCAREAYLDKH